MAVVAGRLVDGAVLDPWLDTVIVIVVVDAGGPDGAVGSVEVVASLLFAFTFGVGELAAAPMLGDGGVDVGAYPLPDRVICAALSGLVFVGPAGGVELGLAGVDVVGRGEDLLPPSCRNTGSGGGLVLDSAGLLGVAAQGCAAFLELPALGGDLFVAGFVS